ncbi:hypothetical protein ABZ260_07075 [Streptosporangium sp. NPDC006013]
MGDVSIGRSRRILVAAVVTMVIRLVVLVTGALNTRISPCRRLEPS